MRTPLQCKYESSICVNEIINLIEPNATISTYAFYSGQLEFRLADYGHKITAYTTNPYVYEFWEEAISKPEELYTLVTTGDFKFKGPAAFSALQKSWTRSEGTMRAALFYVLNRCSETGYISSGPLNLKGLNLFSHNYLRCLDLPANLELVCDDKLSLRQQMRECDGSDYVVAHLGRFSYNLFEKSRLRGPEETPVNHQEIRELLLSEERKYMMIYKYHTRLFDFFKELNMIFVDGNGHMCATIDKCEEVIVTNF